VKRLRILGTLACLLALTFVGATPASADQLYANEEIQCGNSMYSGNGYYELFCQEDSGYWMLAWHYVGPGSGSVFWTSRYDNFSQGLGNHTNQWGSVGSDARGYMQNNGEFALYNSSFTSQVWSTGSWGYSNAYLNLQDDGNLVVYTSSNVPVWSVF
jgi:hypothetical protein